eukprot:m.1168788 g.1168788  ORF g.1168788 m.1168788 type:complete len:85 (-) comp24508_c0_seq75:6368-6622(-)
MQRQVSTAAYSNHESGQVVSAEPADTTTCKDLPAEWIAIVTKSGYFYVRNGCPCCELHVSAVAFDNSSCAAAWQHATSVGILLG